MKIPDYADGLRSLHEQAPTAIADNMADLVRRAGGTDPVLYLADFEQSVLLAIPERGVAVTFPVGERVLDTSAGRAFSHQHPVTEQTAGGTRVWVPIVEGADCTGVLALTVPEPMDEATGRCCEALGMLAGSAIAVATRRTDLYSRVRRRKAMSLPASMQWDLLPPLHLQAPEMTSSAMLEPAYDVGGDCFDHAINGFELDVAIMDAMGHGLGSSMISSLAIGTYRHDRREGKVLGDMHRHLDEVIGREFGGDKFVTGQLGRLDLRTGELTWINAGHPTPLLVREGKVERSLTCRPSLPWGLGSPLEQQTTQQLQPGDAVLFYTDGVTEGRASDGVPFGLTRLHELVAGAAGEHDGPGGIVRRMIREVADYQEHRLRDDATMLWVTWRGPR